VCIFPYGDGSMSWMLIREKGGQGGGAGGGPLSGILYIRAACQPPDKRGVRTQLIIR
jgi:hypothetical protein